MLYILLIIHKLFWWAVLLTLAIFSYHTTTVRWDGHDRVHGSKVGGKRPTALYRGCRCYCWGRSPGRLDLQLLMYQTCLYLWLCINGNKTLVVITFSCGLVIKVLFHFHLWDYNGLWIVLILWGHRYTVYLFESSEVLCWIWTREDQIPDPGFGAVTEMVSEPNVINPRDEATVG